MPWTPAFCWCKSGWPWRYEQGPHPGSRSISRHHRSCPKLGRPCRHASTCTGPSYLWPSKAFPSDPMTPSIVALAGCLVLPTYLTSGLLAMYRVVLLLLTASTVKPFSSEKMSTQSLPFLICSGASCIGPASSPSAELSHLELQAQVLPHNCRYSCFVEVQFPGKLLGIISRVFLDGILHSFDVLRGGWLCVVLYRWQPDLKWDWVGLCCLWWSREIWGLWLPWQLLLCLPGWNQSNRESNLHDISHERQDNKKICWQSTCPSALWTREYYSLLVKECIRAPNYLARDNEVIFKWVKAHVGHPLNEEADTQAELGTRLGGQVNPPSVPKAVCKKLVLVTNNLSPNQVQGTNPG